MSFSITHASVSWCLCVAFLIRRQKTFQSVTVFFVSLYIFPYSQDKCEVVALTVQKIIAQTCFPFSVCKFLILLSSYNSSACYNLTSTRKHDKCLSQGHGRVQQSSQLSCLQSFDQNILAIKSIFLDHKTILTFLANHTSKYC